LCETGDIVNLDLRTPGEVFLGFANTGFTDPKDIALFDTLAFDASLTVIGAGRVSQRYFRGLDAGEVFVLDDEGRRTYVFGDPPAATPEPASVLLFVGSAAAMLRPRRRR
jgi:hypothetical protein